MVMVEWRRVKEEIGYDHGDGRVEASEGGKLCRVVLKPRDFSPV